MTPNKTNPVPTESKCDGSGCIQTKGHWCNGQHPTCSGCDACAPIPTPEVGEWEEELNAILWDNLTIEPGKQKDGSYSIPLKQAAQEKIVELVRSLLSSQSSAFQKKIGEAVDEVVKSAEKEMKESCYMGGAGCGCVEAARAAADKIKKENL